MALEGTVSLMHNSKRLHIHPVMSLTAYTGGKEVNKSASTHFSGVQQAPLCVYTYGTPHLHMQGPRVVFLTLSSGNPFHFNLLTG